MDDNENKKIEDQELTEVSGGHGPISSRTLRKALQDEVLRKVRQGIPLNFHEQQIYDSIPPSQR